MDSPTISRVHLSGIFAKYLNALRSRDPFQLDLSKLRRFTENAHELPIGLGLWASVEHVADDPIALVLDEVAGTLAAQVWVQEGDEPVLLTLRIRAADEHRIAELETIAARGTYGKQWHESPSHDAFTVRAEFDSVDHGQLGVSRWELARATNLYFESRDRGEPVARINRSCVRYDNGLRTDPAPYGPLADARTETLRLVGRSRGRRFAAIDVERGTVVALSFVDHDSAQASFSYPSTSYVGEFFKHVNGEIVRVDAGSEILPLGTKSGWEL